MISNNNFAKPSIANNVKMNMNSQDWEPVVLRKKATTTAQATSSKAVNAAIRSGNTLKINGHMPWQRSLAARSLPNKSLSGVAVAITHIVDPRGSPSRCPPPPCAGAAVETSMKATAGTNKSGAHGPVKNLAKLENETEVFEHEKVSSELKKQIQSARIAKKLTQAQLAQLINEKPQIINDYENGKAIPNPQASSPLRQRRW